MARQRDRHGDRVGHPAAGDGRLAGPAGPEVGSGHEGRSRDHRLHRRRADPRSVAGRQRPSGQAGESRGVAVVTGEGGGGTWTAGAQRPTDQGGERMAAARRILVVEDNELNLKLVRDVLRHAGFEVIEARSGEDGVALAAECHPDLVLMDLQLPGHRRCRSTQADPDATTAEGRCPSSLSPRSRCALTVNAPFALALTTTWRSRSVCVICHGTRTTPPGRGAAR